MTKLSFFSPFLIGILLSVLLLLCPNNYKKNNAMMASAISLPFLKSEYHHSLLPYKLGVRDSLMIAHSFHNHPSFGPAGGMHGATYTCDVEFASNKLVKETNWVIDIGLASSIVSSVLSKYNLKNMDEVFPNGEMTTTEFMAKQIHSDISQQIQDQCKEFDGSLSIKLWESHKAWASYEGAI
mmetsp:Transcript_9120/g.14042  ORF Transcript_9120/g.14042 Transcript_9120/m.14042 type:complete len:182 (-) Transcript_9120:83-628(-)